MGIRVSGANLAAAVANTGCAGSCQCGLGFFESLRGADAGSWPRDPPGGDPKARRLTNGPIGVISWWR